MGWSATYGLHWTFQFRLVPVGSWKICLSTKHFVFATSSVQRIWIKLSIMKSLSLWDTFKKLAFVFIYIYLACFSICLPSAWIEQCFDVGVKKIVFHSITFADIVNGGRWEYTTLNQWSNLIWAISVCRQKNTHSYRVVQSC